MRFLLWIFPKEFRDAYRDELDHFVETGLHEAGSRRLTTVLFFAFDLVRAGVRLRLRPVRRERHDPKPIEERDGWIVSVWGALRIAARGLSRNPGFSFVVLITLSLGVGLNTALFAVVNAVLLQPLDYEEPDRLVYLTASLPGKGLVDADLSGGDLHDLREVAAFEAVEGVSTIRQNLHGAGIPRQVAVGWVSGGFLSLFGVEAEIGRLHREDDPPGTVVLTNGLWREAFGSDPSVLGASIQLDGYPYTIVGVLPQDFRVRLPSRGGAAPDVELWKNPDAFWQNGAVWSGQGPDLSLIRVVARLRAGVSYGDAQGGVDAVVADLRARFPSFDTDGLAIDVSPLQERLVERVRPTLSLLFGAVVLVLLIACANVANLQLVRTHARRREMALRVALGSSRRRIGGLLAFESLLLAVGGSALGVLMTAGTGSAVTRLAPSELPLAGSPLVDETVLAFAVLGSLLVTLLVGVLPTLAALGADPANELGNGRATGVRGSRVRRSLVVAQLALSIVLLVGVGLLTSSVVRLQRVDPGFDPTNVYTFGVSIPGSRYGWPEEADAFYRGVEAAVAELPGVQSAGVVWPMPFAGSWSGEHEIMEQEPVGLGLASYRLVTEAYFTTMSVPVIEGRLFREGDPAYVTVVSRSVAERSWPGRSAVGESIRANPWGRGMQEFEVIGVVGDVRYRSLREAPGATLYFDARSWSWVDWEVHVLVRSSVGEGALLPALRAAVAEIDGGVPVARPGPLNEALRIETAGTRFVLMLLVVFAGTAAVLAFVGLYGVVSYSVGLRSREFGVRLALGSARSGLRRIVVREGGMLTLAGLTIGLAAAWGFVGLLDALLFEVTATDPLTYAAVVLVLCAGAGVACVVPAWRMSRVDPVEVLRAD